MDIREKLDAALDFLLRDAEELTEDVEAQERERSASKHASRGKKRKRQANITDEDFDKRLSKLVQAARSGGGMPRGDQYRLLHTPQIQPPQGTVRFEETTTVFLDNLVYGAPYKPLIPAFRRAGWSGEADVGESFAAFLQLPRNTATERREASAPQLRRYFDQDHRRQSQQYSELLMLHRAAGQGPARRRNHGLHELDVLDLSSSAEEDVTMVDYMHARTQQLSRQTREHTHDVAAWLQYTQHQQDLLLMSGGRIHPSSLAAKQQAVLQTAISHVPHCTQLLSALACHVVRDLKNEEEEPDPVKYHISQLKRLTKQYPATHILWKELFGVLFQQGSGYSVSDVRTCCVDAVRALSKHAERVRLTGPSLNCVAGDPVAATAETWHAECAAAEAVARQVEFEFCSGGISEALMLLRCVCEWFCCPRESWTQPHRLRWFRAFFESKERFAGAKGAAGFTAWVDRQTIDWRAADDKMDSSSESEPEIEPPSSAGMLQEEPDVVEATTENPDEAAEDLEDEELDEIDLLMLQERLGLEVEKQLQDLEARGLSSRDLRRLLTLEGQRCCADAGLQEEVDVDEQQDVDMQQEEDVSVQYDHLKHVLFWTTPDARSLTIRSCLRCIDVHTVSLTGPYINALLPQLGQLADDFSSLSRPLLLGEALGVMFHPYPSTKCANDMARCPVWLSFSTFESSVGSGAGNGSEAASHRVPWFARSGARHQLTVRLLRQLMAANSILQDNLMALRSLLDVESSRKVLPDGQLETEAVAGKRAYNAAKRWISGQNGSLDVWTGFAALESRRGRYSQALQALSTAMNGTVTNDSAQQLCRWPLTLSVVFIEFAACGVPLHSSTTVTPSAQESAMHAARRSMHALLWAAAGKGKARFVPLDKAMSRDAVTNESKTWQQRILAAQVAYQGEVSGFLEVLQGCKQQPGLCSSQLEAASAAVLCAIAFETLGGVCGLLPSGGWDRSVRLFSHVMDSIPDHVRSIRSECHAWACMVCTLAALDRAANPIRRHDLQLKLVRIFPSSPYLTQQLAVLQHSSCVQSRLRLSVSLLQRTAGPAAHPNLYLCSLVDMCNRHSSIACIKSRFQWFLSAFSSQGGGRPRHRNSMGTVDVMELLSSVTRSTPAVKRIGKSGFISPYSVHFSSLKWCTSRAQNCDFFDPNQMPTFWLSYLSLVHEHEDSSTAYGLFYRSVNACGLCKGVWLTGLGLLSEYMKGTETSTLLSTMMGREVPLRTLPAEVLLEQLDANIDDQ